MSCTFLTFYHCIDYAVTIFYAVAFIILGIIFWFIKQYWEATT